MKDAIRKGGLILFCCKASLFMTAIILYISFHYSCRRMEEGGNVSSSKMRMCGYAYGQSCLTFLFSVVQAYSHTSFCMLPHPVVQRHNFSVQSWILHSFSSQNTVLCSSLISRLLKMVHDEDAQSSKV